MADETRSVWGKPQLIVVARNRPEESVLAGCKTYQVGGGSGNLNDSCRYQIDSSCYNCDSDASS